MGLVSGVHIWSSIKRMAMTDDYCFVIADENMLLAPVPRRAFISEEEFREFYELCRRFQEEDARLRSADKRSKPGAAGEVLPDPVDNGLVTEIGSLLQFADRSRRKNLPRPLWLPAEHFGLFCLDRGGFAIIFAAARRAAHVHHGLPDV